MCVLFAYPGEEDVEEGAVPADDDEIADMGPVSPLGMFDISAKLYTFLVEFLFRMLCGIECSWNPLLCTIGQFLLLRHIERAWIGKL